MINCYFQLGNANEVEFLISKGANIYSINGNEDEWTALHFAAQQSKYQFREKHSSSNIETSQIDRS